MFSDDDIATIKFNLLVTEAKKWLGVRESGGPNKGPEVSMFQKAVDHKADGEPWCMAFVMYCIQQVDLDLEKRFGSCIKTQLYKTEHCLTVWNKSPVTAKINENYHPGLICIWQHYKNGKPTTNGHCGIVEKIIDSTSFLSIEGNTQDHAIINRDGDGVYSVTRNFKGSDNFRLKGFLKPWNGRFLKGS